MNIKRVAILLVKEFKHGPRNFIFTIAVVKPILVSLLLSLMFGTLFAGRPKTNYLY